MSAYVVCLTSGGGLPIFSRKKGNAENLPFSAVGSLNGVHMFGKTQKIELLNTLTDDYSVVWKEFHDSLVLIGISCGCTVEVLTEILESIFNAIVLIVGIDEIKAQRNIERLKKELRICYPVIDRLLDSLNCGDSSNKHSSDLVGMAEIILCHENHLIQIVLDSFTECVDSLFSCVLIHGKISAATDSWWTLHPTEIKLLSLLASAENSASSSDVPVFLPFKSPGVAFRFVCCTLIPEIQLCCLCGSTPALEEVEHSATQSFKNSTDILTSALQCHPRNFPHNYHVDGGILGLLLIDVAQGKYMMTRNPHQNIGNKKQASSSHRSDILRTFFYQSVETFLIRNQDERNRAIKEETAIGLETYWCSEYHKCYGMRVSDVILCILYNASIPTYAMRLITEKTLKLFTADKQTRWS